MNIVHVVASLKVGGLERFVSDLAAEQAGRGHGVAVLELFAAEGDRIAVMPPAAAVPAGLRAGASRPAGILRLRRLLRAAHPDIVHAHNTFALGWCALPCRLLGLPVVMTKHGMGTEGRRGLLYRFPRRIVCVSEPMRTRLAARYPGVAGRAAVIANGVPFADHGPGARAAMRARLDIDGQDTAVVWVGRVAPEKALDGLLAAWREAAGCGGGGAGAGRAKLALIGDGPLRTGLEDRAAEMGLSGSVRFLGHRGDARELLPAFDLFVLPSREEGMPIALLEAQAAGLPALVTRVGAMPRIVEEGATGWIVEPGDAAGLTVALRSALAADRAELRRMGEDARRRAKAEFSIGICAARYDEVYAAVAGGG